MAVCTGSGKPVEQVGYATGICAVCHKEVKMSAMGLTVEHPGLPPAPATRPRPRRKPRPIR